MQSKGTPSFEDRLMIFFAKCKVTNRSFPLKNTVALFQELISKYSKEVTLPKGSIYYRARIHDNYDNYQSRTPLNYEYAKPPKKQYNQGGRFNPPGFNYLYLADQEITAIYEVKPSVRSYITVFKGILEKEARVIDFSSELNPFSLEPSLGNLKQKEEIRTKDYLSVLFSLPVNQDFKDVDYAPTRMISDFIKFRSYDGICYESSFNFRGKNFVFFDTKVVRFENEERKVVDINKITYSYDNFDLSN